MKKSKESNHRNTAGSHSQNTKVGKPNTSSRKTPRGPKGSRPTKRLPVTFKQLSVASNLCYNQFQLLGEILRRLKSSNPTLDWLESTRDRLKENQFLQSIAGVMNHSLNIAKHETSKELKSLREIGLQNHSDFYEQIETLHTTSKKVLTIVDNQMVAQKVKEVCDRYESQEIEKNKDFLIECAKAIDYQGWKNNTLWWDSTIKYEGHGMALAIPKYPGLLKRFVEFAEVSRSSHLETSNLDPLQQANALEEHPDLQRTMEDLDSFIKKMASETAMTSDFSHSMDPFFPSNVNEAANDPWSVTSTMDAMVLGNYNYTEPYTEPTVASSSTARPIAFATLQQQQGHYEEWKQGHDPHWELNPNQSFHH
jgi:hypothetical protein